MQSISGKGEDLFLHGNIEAAEKCFHEAIQFDPRNPDAYNNLGVIAFGRGQIENAVDYFTKALEMDPAHKDAILNYFHVLRELGDLMPIKQVVENALETCPHDHDFLRLFREISAQGGEKRKLSFLCLPGLQSFLPDIVDFLGRSYEIRTCYSADPKQISAAVDWADIVWLEWANEMAVHVSRNVPQAAVKQVICRVHSYEVLHGYLPRLKWENINQTIFVADHLLQIAQEICPSVPQLRRAVVIPNGLDLGKFQFRERQPGYNIAVVGSINHKKNPAMWLEILSRLVRIDGRYSLKIAGPLQELRYKYYLEHLIRRQGLGDHVTFFGEVSDIPRWYKENRINYLLSTSHFESFGYAIAEAMAMGYRPIIHAFPSADEIWPTECVFGNVDEALSMILDRDSYHSRRYREFIRQRYSYPSTGQLDKIEDLLSEMGGGGKSESKVLPESRSEFVLNDTAIPIVASYRSERTERNIIVTGIPRSGTSLFSAFLNTFSNTICLNEILYEVDSLPGGFREIRRRIKAGEGIPNRFGESGTLTTDTQAGATVVEERRVRDCDDDVLIASKVNIPYLNNIHKILRYGYKIIALVRDPVYTIGSWNSIKTVGIPEAHVTDDDMHPRWRMFHFHSPDKLSRQAQIWNFYANLIWSLRKRIRVYTYELLTSDPAWVIKDVSEYLSIEPSSQTTEFRMVNQNIRKRYEGLEDIKEAVRRHCPVKACFGYDVRTGDDVSTSIQRQRTADTGAGPAVTLRHTNWTRNINFSRRPILAEKGINPSHLIIAFGGIANQFYMPPFEFFAATESLAYSRVLVRDFQQAWYHLGTSRKLGSFEALLQRLRSIIHEMNPVTFCTVGTSAGGYAALAVGHFLAADEVHALAPQTFIDAANRARFGDRRWSEEIDRVYKHHPPSGWFFDLGRLLQSHNGKTRYHIHLCGKNADDLVHARHLEGFPGVHVELYDCTEHNVAAYLKKRGLISSILQPPRDGLKPVPCRR